MSDAGHSSKNGRTKPLRMSHKAIKQVQLEEIPYSLDSCALYARLRDLELPVFLDSATPFTQRGRYDIISAQPREIISQNTLYSDSYETDLNLFQDLKLRLADTYSGLENDYRLPFLGGAIGYFAYDLGRQLEKLPRQAKADCKSPDALVGIYDWAIITDHHNRRSLLMAHPLASQKLIREIRQRLRALPPQDDSRFQLLADFQSNFNRQQYAAAFERIHHYIEAGDCYQINLAQRFSSSFQGDPWQAYRQLREIAAAPYSGYMQHNDLALMSLSPERFIKVDNGKVSTSPIKGTIARGTDAQHDQKLAEQLLMSKKDRAENLMIVDLLRNDLGKSCKPGSINVEQLFELQSFETVHHLVSTINGELGAGTHALDLLAACFPGGSITGAPKVRAMEIIEQLEPHRRSVYCGAMGYISYDGQMDTNITIRTLLCEQQAIHCWAGGGIVADSKCETEYQECLTKVRPFIKALEASKPVKKDSALET